MSVGISVIIPVYNVEAYLAECLDSVLAQTFDNIEVICVNDGTPDKSGEILEKYALQDERIKVITQKNVGLAVSRNNGLKIAQGKYVYFIDSDDFISTGYLQELYEAAESEGYDVVLNENIICYDQVNNRPFSSYKNIGRHEVTNAILRELSCVAWNKLFRRDFLAKNNLSFIKYNYNEDVPFFYDVMMKVKRIFIVNFQVYYYRQREGSIMKTHNIKRVSDNLDNFSYIESRIKDLKLEDKFSPPVYAFENLCFNDEAWKMIKSFWEKHGISSKLLMRREQWFIENIKKSKTFDEFLIAFDKRKKYKKRIKRLSSIVSLFLFKKQWRRNLRAYYRDL